ncbi:unnamed protein product, partial [Discosporangium mesarthrocarpum]
LVTGKNPRGIPQVVFIVITNATPSRFHIKEDVASFLERVGVVLVETAIGAFNELY